MAKARGGSASSLPPEEEEEFRAIVEQVFRLLDVEKKGALDAVAIKVRYFASYNPSQLKRNTNKQYGLQLLGCEDKGRLKRVMRLIKAELKSTRTPFMQMEQFLQIGTQTITNKIRTNIRNFESEGGTYEQKQRVWGWENLFFILWRWGRANARWREANNIKGKRSAKSRGGGGTTRYTGRGACRDGATSIRFRWRYTSIPPLPNNPQPSCKLTLQQSLLRTLNAR